DRSRLAYPAPPPGSTFFLPSAAVPTTSPRDDLLDDLYEVLALGVADYYRKTAAFNSIGVALSGGRDSLLTLLVAWRTIQLLHPGLEGAALREAVGRRLFAFYMPTRYSGEATRGAAARIAEDLGVPFRIVPIEEAFERELEATRTMLGDGGPKP